MTGLLILWLAMTGMLAAKPDGALIQSALKEELGYEYAWVWQDGGTVGIWSIPAMSMAPTLITGDKVLGIKQGRPPQSGDIWVFQHPHSDRRMVKRVVGMPGDTVQVKDGHLLINGRVVDRKLVRSVTYFEEGRVTRADEYEEQLPGEAHSHLIHEFSDADSLDETPIFKVPAGHVFMLGDNRDNSEDSRAPSGHRALFREHSELWPYRGTWLPSDPRDDAIGFVPIENLIARVATVYRSLHGCGRGAPNAECLKPNIGKHL